MDNDREDRIRRRAYEIWEREGRVGDPEDHWRRAKQELRDMPESGGIAAEDTLPSDEVAAADSAIR